MDVEWMSKNRVPEGLIRLNPRPIKTLIFTQFLDQITSSKNDPKTFWNSAPIFHPFLPNFQAWPAAQKMSKKSTKSAPNNSPIFTHYFDKTSCFKNEQKIVWISIPILHPFTPNFAADTSIPPNTQKSNKLLNKHFWHAKTITIFRKINRLAIFMLSN